MCARRLCHSESWPPRAQDMAVMILCCAKLSATLPVEQPDCSLTMIYIWGPARPTLHNHSYTYYTHGAGRAGSGCLGILGSLGKAQPSNTRHVIGHPSHPIPHHPPFAGSWDHPIPVLQGDLRRWAIGRSWASACMQQILVGLTLSLILVGLTYLVHSRTDTSCKRGPAPPSWGGLYRNPRVADGSHFVSKQGPSKWAWAGNG
jgi:hypothetical protein